MKDSGGFFGIFLWIFLFPVMIIWFFLKALLKWK